MRKNKHMRNSIIKIKIIAIINIITIILVFGAVKALAVESTESANTPTPTIEQKIKELKERLASRVAELNVISQKLVKGEIKTLSDQKIIILSNTNEISINLNEESSFYAIGSDGVKKSVKLSDLKTGQTALSFGAYNSSTNTLTSKTIVVEELPTIIVGQIKSVDKKNYQLSVSTKEKDYLIDHEVTTKNFTIGKDDVLVKSGFSKYEEGQIVYVVGDLVTDKSGKELLSAFRIIVIKDAPSQIETQSPTPTPTKAK